MRTWMILGMLIGGCLGLQAQTLQQKVDQAVTREPLKGAVVGVMVQDAAGHVLASREAGRRMVPASNLKLVTTGTALHALGPDFRFETGIGYTGTVEDGTLHGDVYIIGGGDPTIGVTDTVAVKPDALFWRWKSLLKDAGISRIDGRIIGDGRAYEGHLENTTWGYDDTGTYYGAGCNALSYYENAIDYLVSAGAADEPVKVTQRFPDTPWMHFSNRTWTAPKGTGNSLYLYTTDLAPYAEMRGTYAIDRKPKVEHFANKYGALTCAYYFWQNLRDTGWDISGGYADIDRGGYVRGADFVPAYKAGTPQVLGQSASPKGFRQRRVRQLPGGGVRRARGIDGKRPGRHPYRRRQRPVAPEHRLPRLSGLVPAVDDPLPWLRRLPCQPPAAGRRHAEHAPAQAHSRPESPHPRQERLHGRSPLLQRLHPGRAGQARPHLLPDGERGHRKNGRPARNAGRPDRSNAVRR